jgi:hypothetical protein
VSQGGSIRVWPTFFVNFKRQNAPKINIIPEEPKYQDFVAEKQFFSKNCY